MLSIEEVKKFKEEDIGNVLVSIQKCSRGLRVIEDLIKGYYEDDDFKLKQENINFLVDELEIEIGYEIFLLFNGVEYKVHEDEKEIIPEGKAPLLFIIENIPENIDTCPNSTTYSERLVRLPLYFGLEIRSVKYVIEAVLGFKAENIKIPIRKNFLFFLRKYTLKIPNFVRKIIIIGNSNDNPLARRRNIVNFIYSEYLDSSCIGNDPSTKLS